MVRPPEDYRHVHMATRCHAQLNGDFFHVPDFRIIGVGQGEESQHLTATILTTALVFLCILILQSGVQVVARNRIRTSPF